MITLPAFITTTVWFQKTKSTLEFVWFVGSLVTVSGLSLTTLYWLAEPKPVTPVFKSSTMVHAAPGESAAIPPAGKVNTSNKVVYKVELVDVEGNVKHTYPEVVVDRKDDSEISLSETSATLGGVNLQLPAGLAPGMYSLLANVTYALNPLKTNSLKIEIAKVNIDPALLLQPGHNRAIGNGN